MELTAALPPLAVGWRRFSAPAKLNLFLRVLGRRDDGYHRLQTLFQLLDWGDAVDLRLRDDAVVCRLAGAAVAADDDLAVRAARRLQPFASAGAGVDIVVHKRIPQGGGFGGGSSDAASVLRALNVLWRCGRTVAQLADIGLQLGADVPLFVHGRSAWAEGVGEQLRAVELPEAWYVLIDSGISIATGELFQAAELTRNAPPLKIADFAPGMIGENAFAPLLRARSKRIATVLDALTAIGPGGVTGTGGGCYVQLPSREAALAAATALASLGQVAVVRGSSRSALLAEVAVDC